MRRPFLTIDLSPCSHLRNYPAEAQRASARAHVRAGGFAFGAARASLKLAVAASGGDPAAESPGSGPSCPTAL